TNQSISLKNWKFNDSGSSTTFGEIKLEPQSFLIICAKADTAEFKSFGKVVGLSPWPSLNNSGEILKLLSPESLPIDSVRYSDAWYRNSTKKTGGWTLERRDPQSKCQSLFNWFATVDSTGGTPGKENSIYVAGYDTMSLSPDSLKQLSDTSITINFNKHLDSSTLLPANFEIIPNTFSEKKITTDSDFKKLVLTYDKTFQGGIEYQLKLHNLKDCSGILITNKPENLRFKTIKPPPVVEPADTARMIITEIFADPSPEIQLPLSEFIEIYNPSKDTVDLDKWTLSDPTTKATIRGQRILPLEYLILCPAADTVQYKSFGKTVGLNPWPSLNNSSDQLVLKSFKNRPVDSISYSDGWYKSNIKKQGGWSLEKIDLKSVCEDFFNWTASIDTSGGTPGKQNSVNVTGYDSIVLQADSLKLISDTTVKLYFNKYLNSATLVAENFKLLPATNTLKKITSDKASREVTLSYDKKFREGTEYQISVLNLKDCSGNPITSNPALTFKTPATPQPIPEQLDTAKIFITEIFADPSPEIHLPLVEFIELYNPSKDMVDLDKWTISDPTSKATIRGQRIFPGEYVILCPMADTLHYKPFGKTIGISPWPSLNNASDQIALKSFKNRLVDSLAYSDTWYRTNSKKAGGWSLEKIDLKSVCEDIFNWTASIDTIGGTPGKKNSINISGYDLLSLKADSMKLTSDTTLKVFFNKHLNSATLVAANFVLSPDNSIRKITTDAESKEVVLTYGKKFQTGTEYQLLVSKLKDCSGNSMTGSPAFKFKTSPAPPVVPERADTARVFITEIFADPSPEIHLPLVEFIELYNPSKDTVDLDKWTISDPTSKATIRGQKIYPKEYVILCPMADTLHYKPFGRTIGLSPWPPLNNGYDQIVLKSFKNRLVDSVAYSDAWYKSNGKKSGGWSLEKIDLKSVCEDFFNWTASIDTIGGTPGKKNSVNISGYDLLELRVDSLKLISDTTLKVFFNKHLNGAALVDGNFILSPDNTIKKIAADAESKEVVLTYGKKFQAGTEYQLSVSKLKDCSGNSMTGSPAFKFKTSPAPPVVPERADTARVFITEIFADPSPEIHLPLVEFIELYNPSKDTVDLDKWTISDPTSKATIRGQKIYPKEYVILCPMADTLHYKPFGRTIGLSPWPPLNNGYDQIVLKSFKNRLVDSVAYSDAWYKSNGKKSGGWSLEKIDLKSVCEDFFNWTASIDTIGGTPGKKNSVNISGYDLLELRVDSLKLISDTTLKVFFNKHLNGAALVDGNFILSPDNTIKKIAADVELKEVVLTYGKRFQAGLEYQLSISKLKDCSGNSIPGSVSFKFKFSTPPPPVPAQADTARIFITEIFADPSPEIGLPLAEFIEIYNPGRETIDLNKWILSDPITKGILTNTTIAPGAYIILCPVADTLLFKQFGKTKGISPWPSLGNPGDQITLKSLKQRLVDSVGYSDKWYKNRIKKSGGWSLEKIDLLNNSCNGFYNWVSSIDESGGSPGRANSVNTSHETRRELRIDSIKNPSDSTVTVYLNSIPDTVSLKVSGFSINNEIGRAIAISIEDSYTALHLKFRSKFREGINYTLTADSLFDCRREKITDANNHASFTIPTIPEIDYPILINEIMADPSPQIGLPETEFVELYNPTEKTVSLKGMLYSDEGLQHKFTDGEIGPKSYLILCPEKDTLNFSAFGKVLGLRVWPVLGNEKDILILKNNKGRELQRVAYNAAWYKDNGKKTGGYSLEMINAASICIDFQNWAASKDSTGGTPGRKNSIHESTAVEGLRLLEAVLTDSITLLLTFNKSVDSLSASIPGNYQLNNGVGKPIAVIQIAPTFEQVLLKFKDPLARGHTYRIEATDLRDCAGSGILQNFNSKDFLLTERIGKNAVLVNEILFNPRPGGVDFVEIYNNTKHILDLQDLSIATIVKDTVSSAKRISLKQLLFEPGHYMSVTSDPENIKKEYIIENPHQILKATLPQFNDDKGTVVLLSNGGRVDQLDYNDKMHFQLLKNFEGVSLERSSFGLNTNDAGNFRSATAASGFATPGYKNSQFSETLSRTEEFALTSRTFSPDNDGFEDILQVSYHMPAPGMVANIKIFNDDGVLVKNLLKNSTLNSTGMLIWDGLNEFSSPAGIGIYFIYAEIFDTNGNLKTFRRSFVLARKL
ncbi:lamin tail domain-containing protein, partial [Daejeonella sp.]|uniref:lamin tail domain-containing protein n=1 Tax=Daejeonella sp. TaxID=2805397 RepID=UPI0030C0400B